MFLLVVKHYMMCITRLERCAKYVHKLSFQLFSMIEPVAVFAVLQCKQAPRFDLCSAARRKQKTRQAGWIIGGFSKGIR